MVAELCSNHGWRGCLQKVLGSRALGRWNHWELVWHLQKWSRYKEKHDLLSFPLISHISSMAF